MPILNYTDVISLEDAKNYLRIDAEMNADDAFITQCINASFAWIEKYTNHIVKSRVKFYYPDNYYLNNTFSIYDAPIASIANTDYTSRTHNLKTVINTSDETVEAMLGYDTIADVPEPIIQAAYEIIQSWYYNSDKVMQTTLVPDSVKFSLMPYRRFLV